MSTITIDQPTVTYPLTIDPLPHIVYEPSLTPIRRRPFSLDEAIEVTKAVVAEKGEHHRHAVCVHVNPGNREPVCIAGAVLVRLGVSVDLLMRYAQAFLVLNELGYTDASLVSRFFNTLQRTADRKNRTTGDRTPWGEALREALRAVGRE